METNAIQLRCSLCSRDFSMHELRVSPVTGHANSHLCRMCWAVLCTQPWPSDDTAHGGHRVHNGGGLRPDSHHSNAQGLTKPAFASHDQLSMQQTQHQEQQQRTMTQRRSASMANIASSGTVGMAVPFPGQQRNTGRHPASMPEQQIYLSNSDDPRWGALTSFSSRPQQHHHLLAGSMPQQADLRQPPTFSPVELKNMMDEESLELFESQSHLLDPESRCAVQRQRQYLQWQNSMDEPGPMQSGLERQDSAGSGCAQIDDLIHGGEQQQSREGDKIGDGIDRGYINGSARNPSQQQQYIDGGACCTVNGNGCTGDKNGSGTIHHSASAPTTLLHELQNAKRQIALLAKEREELSLRVQQMESELQTQRDAILCKMCRQTPRNCVVLPCLHFTSCDACFKQHCSTSNASCPCCNGICTGFQTLLMME